MTVAETQNLLKNSAKLRSPPKKRNRNKYFRYHKDHGHDIEDCFKLKVVIEKLIERGHLVEFVTNDNQPRLDNHPIQHQSLGNINMVLKGTSGRGDLYSALKKYAQAS